MKVIEVEYRGPVGCLMGHAVIIPAQSCRNGDRRRRLPFVLEVRHEEVAAQPMATPRSNVIDAGKRSLGKRVVVTERQHVIGRLPLIEPHTTVLHTYLEGVAAARPDQVV